MSSRASAAWTRDHLARLVEREATTAPPLDANEVVRILPRHDIWDVWPVRKTDGAISSIAGGELWVALSAPATGHPDARHDVTRLRLLAKHDGSWADLGDLFPDGASLGSREWAGSAVHGPGDGAVTIFYTAAGRRGESRRTFVQRIAQATGRLVAEGPTIRLTDWSEHRESVEADGVVYLPAEEEHGEPGFIRAFRDPFFFRDPGSGRDHLLFTGSLAGAKTDFNGAVGLAEADDERWSAWSLRPPLLHADGVNNELERPHVVVHSARYYLFFSTQRRTFHPAVSGPTGLYGFVAPSLLGPYEPVNESGLVVQNPPEEPFQAYSWLVLNDLRAVSFVDFHSLGGRRPQELDFQRAEDRRLFGGTLAPVLQLRLDGARAWIEAAPARL
ncbi:MAG: glycoside hydrolase family 68 protein [Actinomycetota bacterium]|nr:glycoside hydrolase family 68 protein [Actinomycetota bacterium]